MKEEIRQLEFSFEIVRVVSEDCSILLFCIVGTTTLKCCKGGEKATIPVVQAMTQKEGTLRRGN